MCQANKEDDKEWEARAFESLKLKKKGCHTNKPARETQREHEINAAD